MVAGREIGVDPQQQQVPRDPDTAVPMGWDWSSSRWAEMDNSGARTTAVDENPPIRFDPQNHNDAQHKPSPVATAGSQEPPPRLKADQ